MSSELVVCKTFEICQKQCRLELQPTSLVQLKTLFATFFFVHEDGMLFHILFCLREGWEVRLYQMCP